MENIKFNISTLIKHPLFWVGFAIRVIILLLVEPYATATWYTPFMDLSTQAINADPWQAHVNNDGNPHAFPYGFVMWLWLLPLTLVCKLIGLSTAVGYGLTLLLTDTALLLLLKQFLQLKDRLLLIAYWLSPIIIFATYWFGFNDIIPVAILCSALYTLRAHHPKLSGFLCGAAVSAKLSMILAIPFFCIYLLRNQALKHLIFQYGYGFAIALALFFLPFLLSDAGVQMLVNNPEIQKTFDFALHINDSVSIFLLPLAYLFTLYTAWQIRRITFDLFYSLLSISFLLVVIFSPAAPGWFVWFIPLVVSYLARGKLVDSILVIGYSCLYVATVFLSVEQPLLLGSNIASICSQLLSSAIGVKGNSLLNTTLLATGAILAYRIWRDAIKNNDYFKISRKPVVVGIAGDSGAGKDFLVETIIDLFGKHSVVHISGDDYHLWDRHKPMWQALTHLNPKANNLEHFAKDLLALVSGKSIMRSHYNHENGKKMPPERISSNDFVVASGLHTLHLPILRNSYDLSIFLDIDEDLRRFFKIERDVKVRGHTLEKVLSSIKNREPDSVKFIQPQAEFADMVMTLKPNNPKALENNNSNLPVRLKLSVVSRHGLYEESLIRVLVGVCGLHVDMSLPDDKNEVMLTIEGESTGEDIALACRTLFPEMKDFLDTSPKWHDGVSGLMQLIVLSHMNQLMSKRLLS